MPAPHTPIEIRELRWPALEPGAAMLRTQCSEVCDTDVHLRHGRLSGVPYPPVIAAGAPASRLAFAARMGASATLDLDVPAEKRATRVRELTGGHGVDVVIEAAGDPRAAPQALDLVRDGGRVVIAGQYTDAGDAAINLHRQISRRHVEIRGCWGCDYSHVHRALQLLAHQARDLPWTDAITSRFGLEQANDALPAVESRAVVKALMVP